MLLTMSLTGGVLILLAALIRRFALGKMPKGLFLFLWGVALVRLLIPFPALYPVSIPLPEALTAPVGAGRATPRPDLSLTLPEEEKTGEKVALPGYLESGGEAAPQTKAVPSVLVLVWLGGAGITALVFLGLYLFGLRRFHAARPLTGRATQDWLCRHPLRRRLKLGVLPGLASPMTHGFLLPVILLPERFELSSPEAEFALEHEYVHVRRGDSLWKLLLTLALVVHWFNPAVWLLWFLAGRDLELSCDEAVLRRLGPDRRRDYANALVALEERRSRLTGLGFGYGCAAERIRAIMGFRQPGLRRRILSGLLVLVLAVCALGGVQAGASLSGKRVYRNGGITLTVPGELAELVLIQAPELPPEQQDPEGDVVFRVVEKESWEEGQRKHPGKEGNEGLLFIILRTPEEKTLSWDSPLPAYSRSVLARRGRETFYSLLTSTENTLAFGLGGVDTRSERWDRWLRVNQWAWDIREYLSRDNPDLIVYSGSYYTDLEVSRVSRFLRDALYGDRESYTLRLGENGRAYPMPSGDEAEAALWDLVWELGGDKKVYRFLPEEDPLIIRNLTYSYELRIWEQEDLMYYSKVDGAVRDWDAVLFPSFLDGRSAKVCDLIRALYDAAKAAN